MPLFSGVVPPLATPLTNSGDLDLDSTTRLIEFMIDAGVHGLFMLGTSGEAVFHDAAARVRLLEHAVKINDGRLPVFAGVIDTATDRVVGHAAVAKAIGVNAVVATAPFYAHTHPVEIADHYRYIREKADIPVLAYDIPFCTQVKLRPQTIVQLAQEGTIIGLKDSSGDERDFRKILLALADHPDFSAFTGSELVVDGALSMGAHGVVPGLGNIDPAGYVRLWNAVQRGDLAGARREQERLCVLFDITGVAMGRIGLSAALSGATKTALRERGVISTNMVARPQQLLNSDETQKVRQILAEVGL
ncbi:4-hydroxy-tetrahydrodipicolinate synthase [Neorhizobium galegae]|uniref:dihydrodipicolinate synthase family protein n=1 Tax=Neorhizobium galegae TaxID=399 RepID=UPI001AE0EC60|nr:dihydrodipicolinate synthase family protein [Neorhizobium galegae]MBP2562192.1 4-hydroxy-tetrahydrodipicolinate synthase [Neorhizobium galegae]MDQ0133826.1 4-hydroxy-tetrahydrodipicolinate synthase [Neorhizobium galegae]